MKVLLVEDYRHYADILVNELREAGYTVALAEDMDEARQYLQGMPPDIVITDFNFPGGNGDEVLDLARSLKINRVYLNSSLPSMSKRLREYTGVLSKDSVTSILEKLEERTT